MVMSIRKKKEKSGNVKLYSRWCNYPPYEKNGILNKYSTTTKCMCMN